MIVLLGQRHGGWEWLFGEHMWRDEEGIAEEMRDWPEYKTATDIVRLWIQRDDKLDVGSGGSRDPG